MLGRLHMSIDDCIAAYISVPDEVFPKKSRRVKITSKVQGRFDSAALERTAKQILALTGHDGDILLKNASVKCSVFACATSKQTRNTVSLTNYRTPKVTDLLDTIESGRPDAPPPRRPPSSTPSTSACHPRSSSTAPSAGTNPVFALWSQAQDAWGDWRRASLRCLALIGTGVPAPNPVGDDALGILSTLKELATEIGRTTELFRQDKVFLDDNGRCVPLQRRPRGRDIGLEESRKTADIETATRRYVQSQKVLKQAPRRPM